MPRIDDTYIIINNYFVCYLDILNKLFVSFLAVPLLAVSLFVSLLLLVEIEKAPDNECYLRDQIKCRPPHPEKQASIRNIAIINASFIFEYALNKDLSPRSPPSYSSQMVMSSP